MLITQVELQNIKSYRHASVTLRRGTTAIRGHNGAGKSTLVEAIGWALFDALPYSQAQFIREGERSGQVTITFRSAEDDREYQVVRRAGAAPLWYVYDPELDHRPAEQKVDVLDFLRRHLGVEGEISLDALFNDALGVPQGALTADFLLTAANRKKKFDALLQVEDFSRAAEKLRETRSYLQESIHTQQADIARLERETGQLDAWREDLAIRRQRERALGAHLAATQRQHTDVATRRDQLLAREREVKRLETVRDVAQVAWEAANATVQQARAQMIEAEQAAEVCAGSLAHHRTYQRVEGDLAAARGRAQTRDHRLRQRADLASALTAAERDAANARTRLDQAIAAERRVIELAPYVTRQDELTQRRDMLARDVERLADARTALASRQTECDRLAGEVALLQSQIASVESVREEARLLAERRTRLDELKAAQVTCAERRRRLKVVARDVQDLTSKRAGAAERERKSAANVAKLLSSRELAERLPALEDEHERLRTEAERLRATIAQHRESRAQSVGGQCPFLREPCQNIRQRGMQSLEAYFDGIIQRDTATLTPVQQRLTVLVPDVERARLAAQYYTRLDEYRDRHNQDAQQLAELDERLAELVAEQAELTGSIAALCNEEDVRAAQVLLNRSDEADRRLRELGPLQAALSTARERLAATEADRGRAHTLATELATAPTDLEATVAALTALGNPRAESTRAEGLARERPVIEAELERHESARAAAAARLATADEALKPFAGLDAELASLEASLGASRPGHQRYLQHQQTAERLPERHAALAAVQAQAQVAASAHERAVAAHAGALALFDAGALDQASQQANALYAELSRATEELKNLQAQIGERESTITRAEALLADLALARGEHSTLTDLSQMLELFRTTIKEAGPYVMRALLRQISTEANRIFGEIMGDRSAQLSWEDDYEIVLRQSGQERRFAQLSGGEQMSAALSVRLALLRSLSRLDIAFFDEPTQNMDGERRGNLAEQLRRVHGFDQLVVISHDDTFEQGLDSVIHLEKRGGDTVLVEEEALVEA